MTTLVVLLVAVTLATLTTASMAPVAAAAPAAGNMTRFAGGLGEGVATDVAQTPGGLTARNGRLLSVENPVDLPPIDHPYPGLVRAIDLGTGTETVLAGISNGGYRGDGGPATSAQLNHPNDAAIDAAGNVYITDTDNHRVRKVTPAGIISTFAGTGVAGFAGDGGQATMAQIDLPVGIAVSPSGDVVFADMGSYRLRKVRPSGVITTIAGTGARVGPSGDGGPATAAVIEAWGVAFDPAGNLYATDVANKASPCLDCAALRKILVDGTMTTVATAAIGHRTLASDESGSVYVRDASTYGIVKIDPSGTFTQWPGTADGAAGGWDVAVDSGNLYASDRTGRRINRVDPSGTVTLVAGNGHFNYGGDGRQARDAQFPNVIKVRSGPTGTYVVSAPQDGDPGGIRRIAPSGVVSTIHPGGAIGMAVDESGNVFLAESGRIRRLAPDGQLSVVAGTGVPGSTGDGGPAVLARVGPGELAVDGVGNLYFNEGEKIRRVNPQGIISTYVGGYGLETYGQSTLASESFVRGVTNLAVDAEGSLYWTAGDLSTTVKKVTCGIVSWVAGSTTGSSGGLAVDAAGSIVFSAGDKVFRTDAVGTATVVAGSGASVPLENVPATSVALMRPDRVAIHPSGRLLFADRDRVYQAEGVTAGRAVPGAPCDTLPDRPVWGTGYNGFGQLGDGTVTDRGGLDTEKPPLTGVTAVSGGVGHSLALRADGTVWAWGWNIAGQLGDGTTIQRLTPVQVPGLTGVVAVAAGAYHSLALKSDGTVWAWGWNAYGQLGDGTLVNRLQPVRVLVLSGATGISAGVLHTLAVRADGSAWAWGWNGLGQLGDGTIVDRRVPVRVQGATGVTSVAAGGLHSLALRNDGSVLAWGCNFYGALGDGTGVDRLVATPVPGLGDVKAVAAGWYHSLALGHDGTAAGWGLNHVEQVGDYTTITRLSPVNLPGITANVGRAVAISAGAFHNVALLDDGSTMVWGWNAYGQQFRAPPYGWDHPVNTEQLGHAAAIGTGAYHSLVAYRFPS